VVGHDELERGRAVGLDLGRGLPFSRSKSTSTSSIQCGRCQRSIACSRAALVVVATCHGKNATSAARVAHERRHDHGVDHLAVLADLALVKSKTVTARMLVPWWTSTGSKPRGSTRRAFSVGNSKKPLIASR
jgi:hypothetical protein